MRKSSKASTWFPEGPGYIVFDTVPDSFPPPIAPSKSDATWGRGFIEATIRAWYSLMVVDSDKLKDIKKEWEARFAALPPREDSTNADAIPEEHKLVWRDLPRRRFANRDGRRPGDRARAELGVGITDALENPPINPITGIGRTAAQVAADTKAYHDYVRATPFSFEPIFQADYIFVLAAGHSLQLHRVASGLFIEDATAEDISFQTVEYLQNVNPNIGGYWGEFRTKPNVNYTQSNKKLGCKYVRHGEINRSNIIMYNVDVVVLKKPKPPPGTQPITWIRVETSSLEKLATICPEFPVPNDQDFPDSHEDDYRDDGQNDEGEEIFGDVEGMEALTDEEEDPPPVFPAGFRPAAEIPTVLVDFVIWYELQGGRAEWCTGRVQKAYPPGFTYRGKPCTHDVKLAGSNAVVGVNLTQALFATGHWLPIEPDVEPAGNVEPEAAATADPAPATAPAPAAAPAPAPAHARPNWRPVRSRR